MANRTRSSNSSISNITNLSRVILLMDVDCFAVQVWAKRKGIDQDSVPMIVLDHTNLILSINYKARALGNPEIKVRKRVDGQWLQDLYPELRIIRAELKRGLVDELLLEKESDKILDAIRFHPKFQQGKSAVIIERDNNDEVYIDCTELVQEMLASPCSEHHRKFWPSFSSHCRDCSQQFLSSTTTRDWDEPPLMFEDYAGKKTSKKRIQKIIADQIHTGTTDYFSNVMLMYGAEFARAFHRNIWEETGYKVSFGVAHNKLLAKISCEKNKPNAITLLTNNGRDRVLQSLDFRKLPGFKRETGDKFRRIAWKKFGMDLVTLLDVRLCPGRVKESIFRLLGFRNPKAAAYSFHLKVHGFCGEPVIAKRYSRSVKASLPLCGRRKAVDNWQDLRKTIKDLAVVFYDQLKYRSYRHREKPALVSVRMKWKKGKGRKIKQNVQSTLEEPPSLPSVPQLQQLIENYVKLSLGSHCRDVARIEIIASNFVPPFPFHY